MTTELTIEPLTFGARRVEVAVILCNGVPLVELRHTVRDTVGEWRQEEPGVELPLSVCGDMVLAIQRAMALAGEFAGKMAA